MAATASRAAGSSTRTPSLGSGTSLPLSLWISSVNGTTTRPAVLWLAHAALGSGALGVTVTVYLLPSSVVMDVLVAAAGGPGGVAGAAFLPAATVVTVAPFVLVGAEVFLLLLQAAPRRATSAASAATERRDRIC